VTPKQLLKPLLLATSFALMACSRAAATALNGSIPLTWALSGKQNVALALGVRIVVASQDLPWIVVQLSVLDKTYKEKAKLICADLFMLMKN
jgi:hypothetical protein